MKCEDYRARLPEFWDGALEDEDRAAVEMHLAACAPCRAEAESLGSIWHGLARIPAAQPSRELRRRFYERLDAYQQGAAEAPGRRMGVLARARGWFEWRPALQAAGAVALLAVGFFAGSGWDRKQDDRQVTQLRAEVGNMRQLVTLSLLQQQNASDRLKGVNWAYRVEQSDTEVLAALLQTVNHDTNVNVRLAAVDALLGFGRSPVARRGLVQAIGKQESPLVQVALIDAVAELSDRQAAAALRALASDRGVNAEVRTRAAWAVKRIEQ